MGIVNDKYSNQLGSMASNKRLEKEIAPVTIRQNIEIFTKPDKGIRYIRHGF